MNGTDGVRIYVALKNTKNIAKRVTEHPFFLERVPRTFRELIEESVKACIAAYRKRAADSADPAPLTDEQLEGMREVGKFAFGVHYNENAVDVDKAIQTAIETVDDGIVRVFKGDAELVGLDSEITVNEGDVFTFVKLTMLSGRMW